MSQRETSLEAPLRDDLLIRKQFVSPCIAKGEGVTLVESRVRIGKRRADKIIEWERRKKRSHLHKQTKRADCGHSESRFRVCRAAEIALVADHDAAHGFVINLII